PPGRAADQIRLHYQSQDRQGTRSDRSTIADRDRRRGDRITKFYRSAECLLLAQSGHAGRRGECLLLGGGLNRSLQHQVFDPAQHGTSPGPTTQKLSSLPTERAICRTSATSRTSIVNEMREEHRRRVLGERSIDQTAEKCVCVRFATIPSRMLPRWV